ncbi:MAG: helix-turn-helix domain-containing protein [Planctomycetes bacterium]|nr:helix-turn-helix domain-containing protein [Planctomycetota bacterium]
MKAYSMDLRKRVLAMCDAGRTTREVARVFYVSEPWVRRLKQRRREEGIVCPRPSGGRRHGHFEPAHLEQLRRWLEHFPLLCSVITVAGKESFAVGVRHRA